MTRARPRVLIHVQHLLGVGHLVRAGRIAKALAEGEFDVTLASGGAPLPGLDIGPANFVQLFPLRAADTRYADLTTLEGRQPSEVEKAERRDRLLSLFAQQQPDILIVEHYPLGRRKFAFELDPLLNAAHGASPRPKVLCSVRDYLVLPKNRRRSDEAIERLNTRFDAVLVHGDPRLIRLSEQVPVLKHFAGQVRYTGYITQAKEPTGQRNRDIVFSLGSGAFGEDLIEIGIAAYELSRFRQTHNWRFLAGAIRPPAAAAQKNNITIENWQPNFSELVRNAALSISQGGYNTMIEAVASQTPSIIVPFEADGQTEQRDRAEAFAKLDLVRMLTRERLTPNLLARTIDEALTRPLSPKIRLDFDGIRKTVSAITDFLEAD